MPYSLFYRRRPLRMISYGVSPYTEMARWILDRLAVLYREQSHVPMLHFLLVQTTDELPGLVLPEGLLVNAREVLEYYNSRSAPAEKLIPSPDQEARALMDRFYWKTGMAARQWAYFYMLPNREGTLRCWQQGAPFWEKVASSIFFPVMRGVMDKGLQLTPAAAQTSLQEIDDCCQMIEKRLSDGRRYLMGDRLTAVDIVFASLLGPAILPDGYGGPLPTLDECPPAMRAEVLRLRETAAGRFVSRLYREDRGRPARDEMKPARGVGAFFSRLQNVITGDARVLRFAFWLLRKFRPVLVAGKTTVVTLHADVVDVLERDQEFTISQINGARMDGAHAPFILGWDRSPRFDREIGILQRMIGPSDLVTLRQIVARNAEGLIDAARANKHIDVVGGLSRVVPTRVVSEFFGTPGPNEQTMMRWMRVLFWQMFLNRSNDPAVNSASAIYADHLRDYLAALIRERKQALAGGPTDRDDMVTRLLRMQSEAGDSLDDDGVRRNISGLIVGAVDTTSAAVAQAIDQLLDRPGELALASEAARAGDDETVSKYVFEALRFNPQAPGLLRFCAQGAVIGKETKRETTVPAGSTVLLGTISAMFDPEAFADPRTLRIDRDSAGYVHFGHGMHLCYGRAINMVQIPEIARALLRVNGLRRTWGSKGRLAYDGPFPDRLVVEFDS
jgi:cytochrome P450/glutathione S-transferase